MIAESPTITGPSFEVKQPKLFIDARKNRVLGLHCRQRFSRKNSMEQNGAEWYLSYGLGHGELQVALIGRPEAGGLR
jgi:hypothetical protein